MTATPATAVLDAGRADVIDGYVLSKPRWTDLGELENTFNRLYASGMIAAAVPFPPDVRKEVYEVVAAETRKRHWAYGRAGFDEGVLMWPVFPMLLWMSLRVKHPQVTLPQAEAMIAEMDDDRRIEVRRSILELLGYSFEKPAAAKEKPAAEDGEALNFKGIYRTLREKKGLAPSEIMGLTLDQVLAELGVDPEEEEVKRAAAERRTARQRETLEKAAANLGVPLVALKDRPAEEVAAAVAAVTGAAKVDAAQVARAVAELK